MRGRGRSHYAVSEYPAFRHAGVRGGWLYGAVTTTQSSPMTAADRCDRCGAQAYVRVVLPSGELLFCAHHARRHASAFADVAVLVQDETDRLLAEHGAPAR